MNQAVNQGYNPEFKPNGIEGGIDTNALPWIDLPQASGVAIKPLRASTESGMFTVVMRINRGTELAGLVYLGAMDMMVLSGAMTYPEGPMAGTLGAGTWGYVPANARTGPSGQSTSSSTACLPLVTTRVTVSGSTWAKEIRVIPLSGFSRVVTTTPARRSPKTMMISTVLLLMSKDGPDPGGSPAGASAPARRR